MRKLTLILAFGLFLYGDVMYKMLTTTEGMMGMAGGEIGTSVYIKGDRSRTETTTESAMAGDITSITITRIDKEVVWTLDVDNKKYSEISLKELAKPGKEPDQKEPVTEIPEIKVEKTGNKKEILGKTCEKVIVSMNATSDEGSFTFIQTMWVAQDVPGYKEIQEFNQKMIELRSDVSSSSMMGIDKKTFGEFQKKISDIEGFPLEFDMVITMGAEEMSFSMKSHSIVTKIDTKPINLKVFEIPEGYSLRE